MTADWSRKFDDPIPLPKGRQLITLKDAGTYITKLPKAEHTAAEWQTAMEALISVVERVFNPSRKETHWGKRKLARDR
jgi:hypothetical protein